MVSIGEFSQATRLTVKTLRYYQELGLLIPEMVDPETGYRNYGEESFNRASSIIQLKELGFTLKEIKEILEQCTQEEDLQLFIDSKLQEIRQRITKLASIENRLSLFQDNSKDYHPESEGIITEINLNLPHLAALPQNGKYNDIGKGFQALYRLTTRHAQGKPYGFFYDMEYRDGDAQIEAVLELKRALPAEGFTYRCLKNQKAVKMVYRGPYGGQGWVYLKLFEYCREKGFTPKPPIIEHYIKGPGVLFTGSPKNYLTECILLLK